MVALGGETCPPLPHRLHRLQLLAGEEERVYCGPVGRGYSGAPRAGDQWSARRVQFDDETWAAIEAVTRDSGRSFQEIADEAFKDFLKKHKQPIGLMGFSNV
jgi:hypothetical protein